MDRWDDFKEGNPKVSLRINMNTAAMTAHRTLAETDSKLSKTIERLSSGYRINTAGDDPAGLVISEKLRAQVSGLGRAISNASDAVNMVRTAEGALNEVSNVLRSMRDLAIHAANTGANDWPALQADQAQISNSIQSLNKIAQETQFGGRKLLDGTAGVRTYIDGAAVMTGDLSYANGLTDGAAIHVNITTAAEKATLSSGAVYASVAGTVSSTATYAASTTSLGTAVGCISINGTAITYACATTNTVATLMASINAVSTTTGVAARFDASTFKIVLYATVGGATTFYATDTATAGTDVFADGAYTGVDGDQARFATADGLMYINGIRVGYASGDNVNDFITKANSKTDLTGITASFNTITNNIDLKTADYGSAAKINITSSATFLGGPSAANGTGVNAIAQVTKVIGGVEENVTDAAWQSGSGLELKDSFGNTITMREAMGSVMADYGTQFNLGVNSLRFQVGAYEGQVRNVSIGSVLANELGGGAVEDENLSTVDVTTADGAQNAIRILDDAIKQISTQRAALGATQKNVLESSITSLNVAKENISASESTIRDTDMAEEMLNLTRNQILQQTGVAMLAQANQTPQTLLRLLQ